MVDRLSKIVAILATIAGLAGYVFLLGAIVFWAQLDRAGLPAGPGVSAASRNELFALGLSVVGAWILALGVAIAVTITAVALGQDHMDKEGAAVAGVSAGAGALITVATRALLLTNTWWPVAAFAPFVVVGFVAWLRYEEVSRSDLLALLAVCLLPAMASAGIAYEAWTLLARGEGWSFGALIVLLGLCGGLGALVPRWRSARRARARLELDPADAQDWVAGTRETAFADARRLRLDRVSGAALVAIVATVGLLLLSAVAVASAVENRDAFLKVTVNAQDGVCVTGTYVADTASEVMIGDSSARALVLVQYDNPAEVEIVGPRQQAIAVSRRDCALSLVDPALIKQGPAGPAGPTGRQGKAGVGGRAGTTGPKGSRGSTGPRGIRGPTGRTGARGATGRRGPPGLKRRKKATPNNP
jgi:hypothetical protein